MTRVNASLFAMTLAASLLCRPEQIRAQDADSANTSLPDVVEFNRDIRPILSDNCFFCHGPDKNKREADLRLDTVDGLHGTDGHVGALVPGKPEESELFKRLISTDEEIKMPPAKSGKSLTERDIQLLKKWIEQGGQFEGHWAFLPIRTDAHEAAVNAPDQGNSASARIDHYIARSLA